MLRRAYEHPPKNIYAFGEKHVCFWEKIYMLLRKNIDAFLKPFGSMMKRAFPLSNEYPSQPLRIPLHVPPHRLLADFFLSCMRWQKCLIALVQIAGIGVFFRNLVARIF